MRFVAAVIVVSCALAHTASADVDDRTISVTSAARAEALRAELRRFIWGTTALPETVPQPVRVDNPADSPVSGLIHPDSEGTDPIHLFRKLEILDVVPDERWPCEVSRAYYYEAAKPNGTVVVLHAGHDDHTLFPPDDARGPGNDFTLGTQRFLKALLLNGYSVVLAFMPHHRPYIAVANCPTPEVPGKYPNGPEGDPRNHEWMFANLGTDGAVLRYFLEPVVQWVNYVTGIDHGPTGKLFSRVVMAGLSGGGWTTTVAAALDPRIVRSYPVAGSIPLYMRQCFSWGDAEQRLASFYQMAGYLDLYVLGTYPGRKQVQILMRHDLYFGDDPVTMYKPDAGTATWEEMLRAYEAAVRGIAHTLSNGGSFRLEIDEGGAFHQYSRNAAFDVILGDLNEDRKDVGAAGASVFIRSASGRVISAGATQWSATELYASGTPAVVESADGQRLDLFYRDERNVLRHSFRAGAAAWSAPEVLPLPEKTRALTDPVVAVSGAGTDLIVDIVAPAAQPGQAVTTNPAWCADQTADAFLGDEHWYTRSDYDLYHWTWTPAAGITGPVPLSTGGQLISHPTIHRAPVGAPAAVRFQNQLHVFVRGEDALLYHVRLEGSSWVAAPMATQRVGGVPAVVVANGAMRVYARSLDDHQLWEFSESGAGVWRAAQVPAVKMTGSPSAIVSASEVKVYVRGLDGKIMICRRPLAGTGWTLAGLGGNAIVGSPVATATGVAGRSGTETVVRHDGQTWSSMSAAEAVPLAFTATRAGGDSSVSTIQLAWTRATADAGGAFLIERSARASNGTTFVGVVTVPATESTFTDTVSNGQAYIYRIRSTASAAYKADVVAAAAFGAPRVRGPIRADDLRDARRATNMMRALADLPPVLFSDPGKAPVRATDVSELRSYMLEAFRAASLPPPSFVPIASRGRVLRIHFAELVDAVK